MATSTQFNPTASRNQPVAYGFFLGMSVLVWLIATLVMRLWGHTFFIAENNLSMGASFLFSVLCLPLFVYGLFRWQKVQPDQRRTAALCLAIPGMLLDVVTTYWFAQVYPNVSPTADGAYGAWLLWGYALVLLTGLMTGQNHKSPAG